MRRVFPFLIIACVVAGLVLWFWNSRRHHQGQPTSSPFAGVIDSLPDTEVYGIDFDSFAAGATQGLVQQLQVTLPGLRSAVTFPNNGTMNSHGRNGLEAGR